MRADKLWRRVCENILVWLIACSAALVPCINRRTLPLRFRLGSMQAVSLRTGYSIKDGAQVALD